MGYNHYLHFIKNELIDPNKAFIQSVDNFLFSIYFDYLGLIKNEKTKIRNDLLVDLFKNIKSLLMEGGKDYEQKKMKIKENIKIAEEENDEFRMKLPFLFGDDYEKIKKFNYFESLDKLMDKNFYNGYKKYNEMQLDLFLYCILVNGLDKTKGEKFEQIKKKLEPLRKKLKVEFSEFDKKQLHKEKTFIFPLRSPVGFCDNFFIIDDKNIFKSSSDDKDDDLDLMSLGYNYYDNKYDVTFC